VTGIHVPLVHVQFPKDILIVTTLPQTNLYKLQMGYTLLVPRYLISLWAVIISSYPQRIVAWIIIGKEGIAGKM